MKLEHNLPGDEADRQGGETPQTESRGTGNEPEHSPAQPAETASSSEEGPLSERQQTAPLEQPPVEPERAPVEPEQPVPAQQPTPAAPPAELPAESKLPAEPEPPRAEPERTTGFWLSVWNGQAPRPADVPEATEVRPGNLVVEGVFSGAERYILSAGLAVPGALVRLKARAFRVAALREIFARRVAETLGLTVLLNAGERFLLAGSPPAGWEDSLHSLQREVDIWLFQHLQPAGLLQCHVSGAVCDREALPVEALAQHKQGRLLQPLEGALRVGLRWNGRAFIQPAGPHVSLCTGCGAVTGIHELGGENLCDGCARDTELGERLVTRERAWICAESEAEFPGPGLGLRLNEPPNQSSPEVDLNAGEWAVLRALPAGTRGEATLAELAQKSAGRKLIGCLRIEVDRVQQAFAAADGDPARTLALARALDSFFAGHLRSSFSGHYRVVVAVSLSTHGTLLAGPWQEVLDLAVRLDRDFGRIVGQAGLGPGSLTLSAGYALGPASVGLAPLGTRAAVQVEAAHAAGGNRLSALGAVIEWPRAAALVHQAKKVSAWVRQRIITLAWLARLVRLAESSRENKAAALPQLRHAIAEARIRSGLVRAWTSQLSHGGVESDWPWIAFLARYAGLSTGARQPSEQKQAAAADETLASAEEWTEPAEEMQPENQ